MYQYAYALKNEKERFSSSGGAFPSIVKHFSLQTDKSRLAVYGAAFDKNFNVSHCRIDDIKDLPLLCGSKYVGSDLSGVFFQVKQDLLNGLYVAFSGTPCQVYALNKYLGNNPTLIEKLLTIDIVCHGTIKKDVWLDFKKWLEGKYKSRIKDFSFRYAGARWQSYPSMVEFENGKKIVNSFILRRYTDIFYSDMALKEKCYSCKFASNDRVSDITIGDFWGIRKIIPEFPYHERVSEVYVNTEKGKKIVDSMLNDKNLILASCLSTDASRYQQAMNHCVEKPKETDRFWCYYKKNGFETVLKKYFNYNVPGFFTHVFRRIAGELGLVAFAKEILKK